MTKSEILNSLHKHLTETNSFLNTTDNSIFFRSIDNKWSIAEQIEHLGLSFFATNLVFSMPKSILGTIIGKNKRSNLSSEAIINQYLAKLSSGSKASFPYQPRLSMLKNRTLILNFWNSTQKKMISLIEKTKEEDLDIYLIPHPIIGKITLREFLYFTIYHIEHHLNSMRNIVATTKL
jgi:hypothetical protein